MRRLAPESAAIELADIDSIPFFNADLNEVPASVNTLKQQIEASDGVLIATPEYNYGIPGVLKNAIDWVSRPAYASVLAQKPIGILGASPGPVGTARAQGQRQTYFLFRNSRSVRRAISLDKRVRSRMNACTRL